MVFLTKEGAGDITGEATGMVDARRGKFSLDRRACGVLLHPTSLPSRYGAGDIGKEAYRFAEFLRHAGQSWWQMLPVQPPGGGPGYAPYSSYSAVGGSPWLISLDRLVGKKDEGGRMKDGGGCVDYATAIAVREPLLRGAFEKSRRGEEFERFCAENAGWLEDFALYSALKKVYGGATWDQWDRGVRMRVKGEMARARKELAGEVEFHRWVQWEFDRQWGEFREHCHRCGVGLIGDIPIFVSYDSVDVWANPGLFKLDRAGRPTVVTGCPPDLFACDGQMWNHPHYRWSAHRAEGFAWWVRRFAAMARQFDAVRIDHFIGFHRAWEIPAGDPTARRGKWVAGPGEEIFGAVRKEIGEFPILAEDLGTLTAGAEKLRDDLVLPGMKVLQFGFGEGGSQYLPHNYPRRCVAYTGTHDNQTTVGWFKSLAAEETKRVLEYVGGTEGTIGEAMIRSVMTSVADVAIVPMQDWLGLGDEARMNVPGVCEGNWKWRVEGRGLTRRLAGRMRGIAEVSGRGQGARDGGRG